MVVRLAGGRAKDTKGECRARRQIAYSDTVTTNLKIRTYMVVDERGCTPPARDVATGTFHHLIYQVNSSSSPASGFACADPVSSMCAVEQCQPDYRRDVSKPAVAHLVIVHSARAAAGVERAAAVTLARSAPALVHPHALRGLGEGVEHAIVRVAVTIVSWVFGQCAGSTLRTLCWRRNHAVRERQTTCEPHF